MEKIKLKIAYKLNDWFPKCFCWAGLVSWVYSDKFLIALWKEFDSKKGGDGCKRDSETNSHKGEYFYSLTTNKIKMKELFEKLKKEKSFLLRLAPN